jgi:hypothetical protein
LEPPEQGRSILVLPTAGCGYSEPLARVTAPPTRGRSTWTPPVSGRGASAPPAQGRSTSATPALGRCTSVPPVQGSGASYLLRSPLPPGGSDPGSNPRCIDHALRSRSALFASRTNALLMLSANKSSFRGFSHDFTGGGQPIVHRKAVRPKNYFPPTKSATPVPTAPWPMEEPRRWPSRRSRCAKVQCPMVDSAIERATIKYMLMVLGFAVETKELLDIKVDIG